MYYENHKIIDVKDSELDGYKRVAIEIEPKDNEDGSKDVAETFDIPEDPWVVIANPSSDPFPIEGKYICFVHM